MKTSCVALVAGLMAVGCGGDGRPRTAPPLPHPILDAPCSEYDLGSDGTVDIVYAFTYDSAGFMIRYVGTPMETGDFSYDPDHFLLHYAQNTDADPEAEYEETYTRDRYGRVLTFQGRSPEGNSSSTYTYDAAGRVTRAVLTDSEGSRTADYVYTGNQLNPTSATVNYGTTTSRITYTSSADERMVHADIDDDGNGTIDRTSDTTYDDERRVIESTTRTGAMRTSFDVRVYNDDGNLTSRSITYTDTGPVDYEFYAMFDNRGMQTVRGLRSPSQRFMSSIYTETDKQTCVLLRVATPAPSPVGLPFQRPSVVELPQLIDVH